jgi:hypothetical protein
MVNFYKEVIPLAHCFRPDFQESGPWCLVHDSALAHSSGVVSEFLRK